MSRDAMTSAGKPVGVRVVLALVLVVALAARLPGLGESSFWLDEALTIRAALAPDLAGLWNVVSTVEIGRSPLFYILLRAWASVVGHGETALRVPSVVAGCAAAVAAAVWAAQMSTGRERPVAAALAGLIVAANPALVGLSREVRAYSLGHALLFAAGAGAFAAIRVAGPRGRALSALAGVCAGLAIGCHAFMAFFVLGLVAAALCRAIGDRAALRRLSVGGAIALVVALLHVPLFAAQVEHRAAFGYAETAVSARHLLRSVLLATGGWWAGPALCATALVGGWRCRRAVGTLPLVVLLIVPPAAIVACELLVGPLNLVSAGRYIAWIVGPLALLASRLGVAPAQRPVVSRAWTRGPRLAVGLLLTLSLIGVVRARAFERTYREDWRAVAAVLRAEVRDGDTVLCATDAEFAPLRLYWDGELFRPGDRPEGARAATGRRFVVWRHPGGPPVDVLRSLAEEFGPGVAVHAQYAVGVMRY